MRCRIKKRVPKKYNNVYMRWFLCLNARLVYFGEQEQFTDVIRSRIQTKKSSYLHIIVLLWHPLLDFSPRRRQPQDKSSYLASMLRGTKKRMQKQWNGTILGRISKKSIIGNKICNWKANWKASDCKANHFIYRAAKIRKGKPGQHSTLSTNISLP